MDSTIRDVPTTPPLRPEDLAVSSPISPIAVANPLWVPHPYLEEDPHSILQRAIDRIPPSHLLPPSKNETFNTPDDAWTRLQDYAFSQGFAIVTGQCGKADPRKTYKCIHHSAETKNWRKKIQTYKDLKRGGSNRTWVLDLGKQEHSHDVPPNPPDYEIHQQR
ncbi:hypothetical protein IMSHALPRED_003174 [Imshaugia aleurites]|uniref:WRKY domain-containing protein n=1 Tax=Imshaugia aleurites TaxID=172621 RepID=A0A8H3J764_9LECA|nr:hypothetical protein IMSHALPRED_003174 [Imshaugia aleurites]